MITKMKKKEHQRGIAVETSQREKKKVGIEMEGRIGN